MNHTHDAAAEILRSLVVSHTSLGQMTKLLGGSLNRVQTQLDRAKEYLEATSIELLQGKPFTDYSDAFKEAHERVIGVLREKDIGGLLTVKILAVASSFSWSFVSDTLPRVLRDHPMTQCHVELLLISPEHLAKVKAGENSRGEIWEEMSQKRIAQAKKFVSAMSADLKKRYSLTISYYENVPHWHGVLIADTWLLLGRTSWEWRDGIPLLRVGENAYRLFHESSQQGSERIELFTNWFEYYQQTGKNVYDSSKG